MSKPIAVLISDIHFTTSTLELASAALRHALHYAHEHCLPLVIAGDTLDSKAIVRAECANRLIEILELCNPSTTYMLVGNHDLINEKSKEHSLNFLQPYCQVIDSLHYMAAIDTWLIPYQNDTDVLRAMLSQVGTGGRIIMHQGVQTAFLGHYVQDKTSLPPEAFGDFRVISGHYHRAQDIKCGRPRKGAVGLFSYIGTPYTTSFAEANDGPKGFQVLHDDGLLELVPTNLRKHVIIECDSDTYTPVHSSVKPGDLVWLKVKGTHSELANITTHSLRDVFSEASSFKLEKIYTDSERTETKKLDKLSDSEILDEMIDRTGETTEQKERLKNLWREFL